MRYCSKNIILLFEGNIQYFDTVVDPEILYKGETIHYIINTVKNIFKNITMFY